MRRVLVLLVPLLLAARPQSAHAQVRPSPEADRLFRESAALYAKGDVKEAVAGFERLLRDHPSSQRTTAAMVMKGKGLARLGEHLEAVRTLRTFLALYPGSSYVPDAYYTLGQVSSRMERDDEALKNYFAAWRSAGTRDTASAVARNAERAFDLTVARAPNLAALEALRPDAVTPRERGFLWLRIGEANAAGTMMGGAATALDTLLLRYPGTVPADRVERLRRQTTERSAVAVGVVLPLMRQAPASALKEVGAEVYDGVLFAHEEYQKSGSSRVAITLTVRDTERDPAVAERAAQEVLADPRVVGILGPVFSASTMPVAAIANASGASMVSPTANASGIAATGPFVFQANADYETRARAMARYAVVERGYRLLAVLSPSEASSRQMAEEFKRTAMSLGAQVVATEWYQRGGPDLSRQLTAIRKAGLLAVSDPMISFAGKLNRRDIAKLVSLGVKPKTIDSLVSKAHIVSARWLLGPNARKLIDSMEITALYASPLLDSLDRPVTALQALYVPIGSPEEIGVITSQLVYYNIRAQVLGSAEWNNLAGLDAHKRYSAGVIFESDSWTDPADSAHAAFVQRYTAARKRKPGKYVLYGYDTARLMFSLIRDGAVTREALRDALARVRDWRGLRSRIGLSGRRVNSWVTILTYDGEAIRPLTEVNMDAPVAGQDRR